MKLPDSIDRLIQDLSEWPSIGPRQATRLAFFLAGRGPQSAANLARDFAGLSQIKICENCFFVHQNTDSLCDVCRNPARDKSVILLVEKETDLLSIEDTKKFTGRYLVLGEIPRTGLLEEWQKLRLNSLKNFINKNLAGKAKEIILGFNPTSLGDFHSSILGKELRPLTEKISRLGRGLPTGGEIEFADDETLGSALERRL